MGAEFYCPKCGHYMIRHGKTPSGTSRFICKGCGSTTTEPVKDSRKSKAAHNLDVEKIAKRIKEIKQNKRETSVQRYVITSAQNDTPIHQKFFESLLSYCQHKSAELLIIPIRYKNPTSLNTFIEYTWPEEILPYMVDKDINLGRDIVVMGDIKINATAANPLYGLETISGTKSAIFGHPQMRMKVVATPQDKLPKILHTTGSISKKNYSRTKEGARGAHHHVLGAVVVECSSTEFFIREIYADSDGSFYDLNFHYSPDCITETKNVEALVTGDEHALFSDKRVVEATYLSENSIVSVLRPKYIVRHDVLDFYSRSHHHEGQLLVQYDKELKNLGDVKHELDLTVEHIVSTTPKYAINLIVPSNHHDALTKWLNRYRPQLDPRNLRIYVELLKMILDTESTLDCDPFSLYYMNTVSEDLRKRTEFLDRRKSRLIKGIDVSQHGDKGINGARGSINSYARTEYKSIIGHSHTPGIVGGCFQVGTSSIMQMEYNKGLTSWMHTHAVIYPNGKRSLIHIMKGKWRL